MTLKASKVGTGLCLGGGGVLVGAAAAAALALDLAQDLGGDGRVEVDGVVSQALRGLVALPAAALEGLPHADLRAVAVFGVVLDAVNILRRAEVSRIAAEPQSFPKRI